MSRHFMTASHTKATNNRKIEKKYTSMAPALVRQPLGPLQRSRQNPSRGTVQLRYPPSSTKTTSAWRMPTMDMPKKNVQRYSIYIQYIRKRWYNPTTWKKLLNFLKALIGVCINQPIFWVGIDGQDVPNRTDISTDPFLVKIYICGKKNIPVPWFHMNSWYW